MKDLSTDRDERIMRELSEAGRGVIEALVKASVAWQSPRELALAMSRDLEETTDLVADLDALGWLSAWERETDVVVTLSVAGASILGLKLVESGHDEVPRWARQSDPDRPGLRASGVFRGERAASLELVVDPSSTVEDAVLRDEEARTRSTIPADPRTRVLIESLPGPTHLMGLGLTPWPGPGDGLKVTCPSCCSKRLGPLMYCLYCDRWGLDHLLIDESSTTLRPAVEEKDDSRRRELERQNRKARRKARLQLAQADADRSARQRKRRA